MKYINASGVREFLGIQGSKTSEEFLTKLDDVIENMLSTSHEICFGNNRKIVQAKDLVEAVCNTEALLPEQSELVKETEKYLEEEEIAILESKLREKYEEFEKTKKIYKDNLFLAERDKIIPKIIKETEEYILKINNSKIDLTEEVINELQNNIHQIHYQMKKYIPF